MHTVPTAPTSRRQFVKTLSAGGAVSAMPGILQSQQAPSQNVIGANSRINVACVGLSDRFTDALLPAFLKSKDELNFDMVALADLGRVRREKGKALLEKQLGHGIDLYLSIEGNWTDAQLALAFAEIAKQARES